MEKINLTNPRVTQPELINTRRSLNDGNFLRTQNAEENQRRLCRALGRLRMWECSYCHEIFPEDEPTFFSVCRGCWEQDEGGLSEVLDFDSARDADIAHAYRKWMREGNIWNLLAPVCPRAILTQDPLFAACGPPEFVWLLQLFANFEHERICRAAFAYGERSVLDILNLVWKPDVGLMPCGPYGDRVPPSREAPVCPEPGEKAKGFAKLRQEWQTYWTKFLTFPV